MSQENVEIVKRLILPAGTDYKAVFSNDDLFAAAKAAVESLLAPDCKVAWFASGQLQAEFTGVDGLREFWLDWLAPWATYYDDIEDVIAVGDERVVVLGRERGYRLDTDGEVDAESAGVYFIRDGKISRVEYYPKQFEALEAVGLSE